MDTGRKKTSLKLITYGHKDWFKEEKHLPRFDVLPPKRRCSHAEAVVKSAPEPRDGSEAHHRQKHVHVHVHWLVDLQCEEPWHM